MGTKKKATKEKQNKTKPPENVAYEQETNKNL